MVRIDSILSEKYGLVGVVPKGVKEVAEGGAAVHLRRPRVQIACIVAHPPDLVIEACQAKGSRFDSQSDRPLVPDEATAI